MELVAPVLLSLLAVGGAVTGIVVATRRGADRAPGTTGGDGLLRVTADVHTGWEQTLVGLIRELGLPRSGTDLGYGALYLEMQTEQRAFIRSRSEIGRGFLGVLELDPRRSTTRVTYAILRLPGDDDLHMQVLELELRIIAALRRIDREVDVQLAAGGLREFGRLLQQQDGARDPSS